MLRLKTFSTIYVDFTYYYIFQNDLITYNCIQDLFKYTIFLKWALIFIKKILSFWKVDEYFKNKCNIFQKIYIYLRTDMKSRCKGC